MLTLLGFAMVITFMVLIMTKRLSPMVALILIPIIFAFIAGFGGDDIGPMMIDGVRNLAPTGVMLMFAILYFGLMIDTGLFDPIVHQILKLIGGDPMKVVIGTAVLASIVSLDGDGSTTYMIVCASMLPLYHRLGMNPLNLTCVTILAGGVMNLTPWGGPLARATSALHVDPAEAFVPMIPVMAVGIAGVILLAWHLGKIERNRLGELKLAAPPLGQTAMAGSAAVLASARQAVAADSRENPGVNAQANGAEPHRDGMRPSSLSSESGDDVRRPKLLWVNAALTAALMVCLIMSVLPLPVLFMIFFAIALIINYPKVDDQRKRVAEHSKNVLAVVSIIFAAGIFTGILGGTGMVDAISHSFLTIVPPGWGPYFAPITAIASMPFTFFISNDAFYFGVLPIVSDVAGHYGVTPVEMVRASMMGQPIHLLSPLVPSTYLLVGLAGVEFGDHQKFTLKWAALLCVLMTIVAMMIGIFPFVVR